MLAVSGDQFGWIARSCHRWFSFVNITWFFLKKILSEDNTAHTRHTGRHTHRHVHVWACTQRQECTLAHECIHTHRQRERERERERQSITFTYTHYRIQLVWSSSEPQQGQNTPPLPCFWILRGERAWRLFARKEKAEIQKVRRTADKDKTLCFKLYWRHVTGKNDSQVWIHK